MKADKKIKNLKHSKQQKKEKGRELRKAASTRYDFHSIDGMRHEPCDPTEYHENIKIVSHANNCKKIAPSGHVQIDFKRTKGMYARILQIRHIQKCKVLYVETCTT